MAGVYKLASTQTPAELKQWLKTQKTVSDKERIQLLYRLKTEQAKTVQDAAALLARHRITLQKWLHRYRKGGLEALLEHKPRTGRRHRIPQWAQEALTKRLHQSDGFNSYGELDQWLETQLGITVCYKTVHQLVPY